MDKADSIYVSFAPSKKAMRSPDLKSKIPKRNSDNPFYDPREDAQWEVLTGSGDIRKILATAAEVTKETLEIEQNEHKTNVTQIVFAPSDSRRSRIYSQWMQSVFPEWKPQSFGGSWMVFSKTK
jgi:hypothetical protein